MNGPLLPIVATFFSLLLCIVFFCKKRIKLFENNVYGIMLLCILFDSVLVSVLFVLSIIYGNNISLILLNILNKLDFLFLIIYCNSIFVYTILVTYSNLKLNKKALIILTTIFDIIIFFFVSISRISILNEGSNFSVSGSSVSITLMACGMYILLSIIITISSMGLNPKMH